MAVQLQPWPSANTMTFRWYLVRTKPAGESIARTNLERQRYEVYCPRLVTTVRRRNRWREQVVALFPGYLFLRLNVGLQSLAPVRSTTGVADLVRFGVMHAVVPDSVIDELRGRADPMSGLHRLKRPGLVSGMRVRVTAGPFDGFEGIFEREAGADRVTILLKLLGHETRAHVSAGFVQPVRQVA